MTNPARPLSVALALLSLLGANIAFAGSGVPVPVRKPGLWKITSISAAHGMNAIEACIGPEDSIAATTSPGECAAPEVQAAGDQTIVNVVCTSAQGREKTSTLFTGDFTSWYRGIVKMTFDPPVQGVANLGVTLDATYAGACP
jgi:hypothetical protein